MLLKPGWPLMLLPCSLPAAESWGAPEGLCSQPRHDAELPGAAGPCAVRRRPQGKGAPGWPASSPADRRLGTAVTAVPAVSLLECMPQHGCLNPAWMQVVDSWWHGLPVVTTPIGAEGMSRADADPRDVSAAGAAAGGAAPALPADPAADGYVWQQGDCSSSSISSSVDDAGQPQQQQPEQQEEWGGLCGGTTAAGIASAAVLLYSDQRLWEACQARGFQLLRLLYAGERNLERVQQAVAAAAGQMDERRRLDFSGAMLWQQSSRSTDFFSRWIELKEGLREEKEARQQEGGAAEAAGAAVVQAAAAAAAAEPRS